jgi:Cu/Ag efflux protein CusF
MHGPAKSLGMDEGMTMIYRVKDPAMFKQVKVGDTVTARNWNECQSATRLESTA